MKYRKFGRTGFEVSALGLGCMRLPTVKLIPQRVDNRKALQDGYRDKVHLVTKLFMPLVRKPEDFDRFLDRQLEKLKTDHLDTYLFHSLHKGYFEKLKDLNLMEKMIRAREQGKIRYIGFSFHDVLPVFREIVDYFDWDVVQIQYNYMDTAVQATHEGLKYAGSRNMAVVVMEPVKGGQLANPPKEAREVMARATVQRGPVDWALQYLWNLPEVSVVISGMGSQKMLDENCESAERSGIGSLSQEDNAIIEEMVEIYRKNILVNCTACQYCMNCPSGVSIPQNFAIINNLAMEKSILRNITTKRSYRKLAGTPETLNTEKTNGNPLVCTECGICVKKCPQGINIPEELKKVGLVMGKGRKIKDVYRLN